MHGSNKMQLATELPTISVVIPAKNEERNITRILSSILGQEYPLDLIDISVIDNHSTDNTVEVARGFDKVTTHISSGTIGSSRNLGADESTGDIIAFVDADCIAPKNWLNRAVKSLSSHPNAAIVSAVVSLENDQPAPWVERYWISYINSKYQKPINFVETISSFCFCIYRKDFEAVGGFDSNLATCEDVDLGYRIKQSGRDILIDTDIKTVHSGNAKSLYRFFLRQLWQGGSNLNNLRNRKLEKSEMPSILIPALFIIMLLVSALLLLAGPTLYSIASICLAFSIPTLITIRKNTLTSVKDFFAYFIIWSTYLLARGLGFFIKIGRSQR